MGQSKSGRWTALSRVTVQTGHARASRRDEVEDDVLQALAPVLAQALETDAWADVLGSGWYLSACESDGRLKFRLAMGIPGPGGAAPIRCTVIPGTLSHAPTLEVDLPTGENPDPARWTAWSALLADVGRVEMAGDLERGVAWAWLESPDGNYSP